MLDNRDLDMFEFLYDKDENNKLYEVFSRNVSLGTLLENSEDEYEDIFDVEIETHGVSNQLSTGDCWIHAPLNILREEIIEDLKVDNFYLSQKYLSFFDKLEKFNYALELLIEEKNKGKLNYNNDKVISALNNYIASGGTQTGAVYLIKKYGIVPQSVYPDTYNSKHDATVFELLSRLAKKFYIELKTTEDSDTLLKKYNADAYTILCRLYGKPPKHFNYTYKNKKDEIYTFENMSPLTLLYSYLKEDFDTSFVLVMSYKDNNFKYNNVYEVENSNMYSDSNNDTYLNLDIDEVIDLIVKQISSGELVELHCTIPAFPLLENFTNFFDRVSNLHKIDFNLTRENKIEVEHLYNKHAIIITGVRFDEEKNPIKFKLENSWGETYGSKGYHTVTTDWLKLNLLSVKINTNYLTDKQKKIISKPKRLIKERNAKF